MPGVVLERVAGLGVGEYGQPIAVEDQPGDDGGELVGSECELAAAAGVGADGLVVHAPDGDAERPARRLAQRLRPLTVGGVEVDVGMVALDRTHRGTPVGTYPLAQQYCDGAALGATAGDRVDAAKEMTRRSGSSVTSKTGRNAVVDVGRTTEKLADARPPTAARASNYAGRRVNSA